MTYRKGRTEILTRCSSSQMAAAERVVRAHLDDAGAAEVLDILGLGGGPR